MNAQTTILAVLGCCLSLVAAVLLLDICVRCAVILTALLRNRIKYRRRQRAVERRIIANAKGGGVWDKPHLLGGRALELYARDMCGLKRGAMETDRELRARCAAASNKPQKRKARRKP